MQQQTKNLPCQRGREASIRAPDDGKALAAEVAEKQFLKHQSHNANAEQRHQYGCRLQQLARTCEGALLSLLSTIVMCHQCGGSTFDL